MNRYSVKRREKAGERVDFAQQLETLNQHMTDLYQRTCAQPVLQPELLEAPQYRTKSWK